MKLHYLFITFIVCAILLAPGARADDGVVGEEADVMWLEEPLPVFSGQLAAAQALRASANTVRVLHVGAHPDDELSPLVCWLARSKAYRTAYLSFTRGEGGQNALGAETGAALGVLRTEELLAARAIDGAEQYFLDRYDFGFSKTPEETLAHWGRESTLEALVRFIRWYRPKYVISCWMGDPGDGHGHHQAVGQLCRLAFELAADPDYAPAPTDLAWDPGGALPPFHPDALLVSRWRADPDAFLTIETGLFDPLYGRTSYQLAARGRSLHRSQDMGAAQSGGSRPVWLRLIAPGDAKEEGEVRIDFHPPVSPLLHALAWHSRNMPPEPDTATRTRQEDAWRWTRLAQAAAGPSFEVTAPRETILPGEEIELTLAIDAVRGPLTVEAMRLGPADGSPPAKSAEDDAWRILGAAPATPFQMKEGERREYRILCRAPSTLAPTTPGFARGPGEERTLPIAPAPRPKYSSSRAAALASYPPLFAECTYRLPDYPSGVAAPAVRLRTYPVYVWADPHHGERRAVLKAGLAPERLEAEGIVAQRVDYPHIQPQTLYERPFALPPIADLAIPEGLGASVAYIAAPGDDIPATMRRYGLAMTVLEPAALAAADWARFRTVVAGPRAYELVPELAAAQAALAAWVQSGGTMVVLYNKYDLEEMGAAPKPFRFHRPHDRVTVETAPVEILAPDAPPLSYPHRLGAADFDDWVQERSLYEFGEFDEADYRPLLASADPGEAPHRGLLLEADWGRGRWYYCALALHRQVPAGVAGGVRLFVNLAAAGLEAAAGDGSAR